MATYMPLDIAQALVQLNHRLDDGFGLVNQRMDQLHASIQNIRIIKRNRARVGAELEPLLKTVRLEIIYPGFC